MLKHYKLKFILRILFLMVMCGLTVYSFLSWNPAITVFCGFSLIILFFNVLWFQDRIQEHVNYFFEAILNDDFSMTTYVTEKDTILSRLNKNMSRINERIKKTMVENQQKEQYFRALIEHINVGVLTYDEDGFIVHANSSVKELFDMKHLTHVKQLEKYDSNLAEIVCCTKTKHQQLVKIPGKEHTQTVLIKSVPFISQQKQLMLLTIQDIDQQLDEKELDSWLRLIRVLTHEIMNGIAPITSLSQSLTGFFMHDGNPVTADQLDEGIIQTTIKGLSVINDQGEGLIKFVESYRKLTRLPKPNKAEVELKPFLEKNIVLSRAGSYGTGVDISLHMQDELSVVMADEKMLAQVVINIIKNGFEALQDTEKPIIKIEVKKTKNEQTEIAILNNGPEIPPDVLNEIFVPFFTTKENGSGIGLSLSRQILRLHGGALKVNTNPQKTVFSLILN